MKLGFVFFLKIFSRQNKFYFDEAIGLLVGSVKSIFCFSFFTFKKILQGVLPVFSTSPMFISVTFRIRTVYLVQFCYIIDVYRSCQRKKRTEVRMQEKASQLGRVCKQFCFQCWELGNLWSVVKMSSLIILLFPKRSEIIKTILPRCINI